MGVEPIQWLFHQSASHWAGQVEVDKWEGLRVYTIDGTQFRVEDTPECREHFGSANTASEYQSGYPVMQLTCLMDTATRLILKAAAGPYREAEITQASQLVDSIDDNSVLLMDKLYHGAELLHHVENKGSNRHSVTPLKKDINYEIVDEYDDNDWLVKRKLSSHAQKQSPSLPKEWYFRVIRYQLMVSLNVSLRHHCQKIIMMQLKSSNFTISAGKLNLGIVK
ncbi:transposase [Photobacterium sp. TLY01]|nr:transposase [Photobacterium sp. TLY01]